MDAGGRVGTHDGVPTAAPHGGGIDAISGLGNRFDSYTAHEPGTVLWMQLWGDPGYSPELEWDIGVVYQPIPSAEEWRDAICACIARAEPRWRLHKSTPAGRR